MYIKNSILGWSPLDKALHAINLGSIHGNTYGPLEHQRSDLKQRARSKP